VTTIRTTCPECGEVDMSPESILLSLQDRLGEGSYRFSCPECRGTVEKSADRKIVALLLSAGVGLADDCSAGPVQEASHTPRPAAPPFTVDDVLAFRALLNDDELLYRSLPGV
jgi:hypothetical protein